MEIIVTYRYKWKSRFLEGNHDLRVVRVIRLASGSLQISVVDVKSGLEYVAFEDDLCPNLRTSDYIKFFK